MSISHLPVELLDLVCSHLSSSDLAALSSTCPLFYPILPRTCQRAPGNVRAHLSSSLSRRHQCQLGPIFPDAPYHLSTLAFIHILFPLRCARHSFPRTHPGFGEPRIGHGPRLRYCSSS